VAGMAGGEFLTIGELARAAGLTAKTVRFWSDQGLLPPAGRTPAGYRLYDPGALARLGLIRALRDLGVGLAGVRKVLDREITIGEVAAVHAAALEVQVRALRLQQAVLRAVASRGITTAEEFQLMHKLANLSAAERRRMVTDFIDDTFAGIDVSPGFLTMMRGAMPDLPGEPTREQIEAGGARPGPRVPGQSPADRHGVRPVPRRRHRRAGCRGQPGNGRIPQRKGRRRR
jgi:DNA-binding transcriptional MerR regulator